MDTPTNDTTPVVTEQPKSTKMRSPEQELTEHWTYSLLGCFGNWKLCCATFCCWGCTYGKNEEYFGEEGIVNPILYCIGLTGLGAVVRWRIRQHRKIKGSMTTDVLLHCLLPCCALIQENKELYGFDGSHVGEKIKLTGASKK